MTTPELHRFDLKDMKAKTGSKTNLEEDKEVVAGILEYLANVSAPGGIANPSGRFGKNFANIIPILNKRGRVSVSVGFLFRIPPLFPDCN